MRGWGYFASSSLAILRYAWEWGLAAWMNIDSDHHHCCIRNSTKDFSHHYEVACVNFRAFWLHFSVFPGAHVSLHFIWKLSFCVCENQRFCDFSFVLMFCSFKVETRQVLFTFLTNDEVLPWRNEIICLLFGITVCLM